MAIDMYYVSRFTKKRFLQDMQPYKLQEAEQQPISHHVHYSVSQEMSFFVQAVADCRDALIHLLAPVKVHLEELVVERCSDFLSIGMHHFSPLASLTRLKVQHTLSTMQHIMKPNGLAMAYCVHAYRVHRAAHTHLLPRDMYGSAVYRQLLPSSCMLLAMHKLHVSVQQAVPLQLLHLQL